MSREHARSRALTRIALATVVLGSCLAAAPARPSAALATAGGYTLTQALVSGIVGIWQLVVGRPLTPTDRQAIAAVDVDIFRRDPAWLVSNARQAQKVLPRLRREDAVGIAGLRQNNLTDIYCTPQTLHMTPDDAARMQAVVAHYIPIVGVDPASGNVITGPDVDAWVVAARFVSAQAHVPGPSAHLRADLVQLARNPSQMGPKVEADAAGMEHNWAAMRLVWPHLGASQRRQVLGQYLGKVKTASAHGQGATLVSVVALQSSKNAAGDYPYALDPRLMAYKTMMDMRTRQFDRNMLNYNMQNMLQSQENYRRSLRGEEPDTTEIPLPVP